MMRTAVCKIHELSFVYGSRTTEARWNVVSHSRSVRPPPDSGVRVRSRLGLGRDALATGSTLVAEASVGEPSLGKTVWQMTVYVGRKSLMGTDVRSRHG